MIRDECPVACVLCHLVFPTTLANEPKWRGGAFFFVSFLLFSPFPASDCPQKKKREKGPSSIPPFQPENPNTGSDRKGTTPTHDSVMMTSPCIVIEQTMACLFGLHTEAGSGGDAGLLS